MVSLTALSDGGQKKTAFTVESKQQVRGTEGSIPGHSAVRNICQREDPSGPLLSGRHQFTAHQVPKGGQLDGQWQWQLDKHSAQSPLIKKQKKQPSPQLKKKQKNNNKKPLEMWLSLLIRASPGDF